jgi:hypothetical protein
MKLISENTILMCYHNHALHVLRSTSLRVEYFILLQTQDIPWLNFNGKINIITNFVIIILRNAG